MSTLRASSTDQTEATQLFDQWLEHWQEEPHSVPSFARAEPAAAAAPPTQEAGTSPMPASPVAAAPLPRRHPEAEDDGLEILQALTETVIDPGTPALVDTERQVGGAIVRFPGRVLPTPRPTLTAPAWAVPPTAVPAEERLAALEPQATASGLVLFAPRAGLRPVLTAATVVSGAATGLWVLAAFLFPTSTTLGVATALAVLTCVLWQARMRARGTAVTVEDGVLKIARGESRHQFPLTGVHPPIDIVGEPGSRGWKVLIQRRGMAPYVVDDRMVDPFEFTETIRRFRPRA
jgi:hypothetical protein